MKPDGFYKTLRNKLKYQKERQYLYNVVNAKNEFLGICTRFPIKLGMMFGIILNCVIIFYSSK